MSQIGVQIGRVYMAYAIYLQVQAIVKHVQVSFVQYTGSQLGGHLCAGRIVFTWFHLGDFAQQKADCYMYMMYCQMKLSS